MPAASILRELVVRQHSDGAFVLVPGGELDLEATTWATLTLALSGEHVGEAERAGAALVKAQRPDGRLAVAPPHPGNYWPTAIALLAWRALDRSGTQVTRALDFLEAHRGDHYPRPANWQLGHDPAIEGWPWVDGTSSWVEPTAFCVLALASCGRGEGVRAVDGRRLLLDRQIPHGGWNYGNSSAFERELLPSPETTGLALAALAGHVAEREVEKSLAWLVHELSEIVTPLSLAWAVLGLSAWNRRPLDADPRLADCARRDPAPAESYDTTELALLALASTARSGLAAELASPRRRP